MSFLNRATIVLVGAIVLTQLSGLPALATHHSQTLIAEAVAVGMSKKQVLRIMGKPTSKSGELWMWIKDSGGYSATFRNGKVIRCGAMAG